MIGYVCLGTNDIARATKYYDALLGGIGGALARRTEVVHEAVLDRVPVLVDDDVAVLGVVHSAVAEADDPVEEVEV